MNIRDLEYLVALDEHRHFGRAAAACYVSQPTLSTQLKKLESHLGVPLVERSARSVLLTSAGEAVVARARKVLAEVRDIEAIASEARNPRSGTLRLGVFPTLGPYLLPHVLERWRVALPELKILLVEERSAVLLERVQSGALDAVMLASPIGAEALESELLFREPFCLAAPAGHPLAARSGTVSSDELKTADLLLLEDGHCLREQALEVCSLAGAQERGGLRATSLETLRYMVATGVGVTLLPKLATLPPVAPLPGLSVFEFGEPVPSREVRLSWRPSSTRSVVLQEIAQATRQAVQGLL